MRKIYDYIVTFALITLSVDTLLGAVVLGSKNSSIILIIVNLPLYVKFLKNKSISKDILIPLLFIAIILISLEINEDFRGFHFYLIFLMINAYIYCKVYSFSKFKKYYINIMFFLSIYSLITTYIIKSLEIAFPIIENAENVPFYNYLFSYAVNDSQYMRNFGIFREPGVYQIFIILAIIFELNEKKINKYIVITLSITMISTFSTVGIVNLCILAIFYFISNIHKFKINKRTICSIVLVIVGIGILTNILIKQPKIKNNLETSINKINSIETITGNNARWNSLKYLSLHIFDNPLFGKGCSFFLDDIETNTNTIISMAIIYGLPLGIIYLLLLYKFTKICTKDILERICVFIILILSLFCQYVPFNTVIWAICFYGIIKEKGENLDEKGTLDSKYDISISSKTTQN